MTWAKLDDGFHAHRKVRRASLEARGLFATALSYAAFHLTDGHVDTEWLALEVPQKVRRERLLAELVRLGLFDVRDSSGYWIHDYLSFNESRERVLERREDARKRKEKYRRSRRDGQGDEREDERGTNAGWNAPPDPTRPDPTRPSPQTPRPSGRGSGAHLSDEEFLRRLEGRR